MPTVIFLVSYFASLSETHVTDIRNQKRNIEPENPFKKKSFLLTNLNKM